MTSHTTASGWLCVAYPMPRPAGQFKVCARKGAMICHFERLTAEQAETFDPALHMARPAPTPFAQADILAPRH